MPIAEGQRTQNLVEILEYAAEHDGINVKEVPYISKDLEMDVRKLYSLINLSWELRLLQRNEEQNVYTISEKAERFLKGYYRATGEVDRTKEDVETELIEPQAAKC